MPNVNGSQRFSHHSCSIDLVRCLEASEVFRLYHFVVCKDGRRRRRVVGKSTSVVCMLANQQSDGLCKRPENKKREGRESVWDLSSLLLG